MRHALLILSLSSSVLLSSFGSSLAGQWSGGGPTDDFSDAANWIGGVPANDGTAILTFSTVPGSLSTPAVDTPWDVLGIRATAASPATLHTFDGSFLQVGASGIVTDPDPHATELTFHNKLILTADQTWSIQSPLRSLQSLSLSGHSIVLDTDANLTLWGGFSGIGFVQKRGSAILRLEDNSTIGWSGLLQIDDGIVILGHTLGPAAGGAIIVGDGIGATQSDKLLLAHDDQLGPTIDLILNRTALFDLIDHDDAVRDLELSAATIDLGTGQLTMHGDLLANDLPDPNVILGTLDLGPGSHDIDVHDGVTAIDLRIGGLGGTDPSVVADKIGAGTLALDGPGDYAGALNVRAGAMEIGSTMAAGFAVDGASLQIDPGGRFTLDTKQIGAGLRVRELVAPAGSTVELWSGTMEVVGGALSFPTDSVVLGSSAASLSEALDLKLSAGATASVRYAWVLGDLVSDIALTTVSGFGPLGPTTLSNFGGGGGADLIVGDEGRGILAVQDGALVEFNDDLRVALASTSIADLNLSHGGDGQPATVRVLGGNAEIELGRLGTCSTLMIGDTVLQSQTDLVTASQGGSSTLNLLASGADTPSLRALDDIYFAGSASAAGGTTNVLGVRATIEAGDVLKLWPGAILNLSEGAIRATTLDVRDGTLNLSGDTIVAADTILGDLDLGGGTIEPGDSPGTTHIAGELTLSAESKLGLELASTGSDLVTVDDGANLGGTLEIRLLDGFVPSPGAVYVLLSAGSLSGDFDTIEVDPTPGFYVSVTQTATRVVLTVLDPTNAPALPTQLELAPNVPNPFNPRTQIRFALPHPAHVRLTVFDLAGRRVRTLWQGRRDAGHHSIDWDGTNQDGRGVASGTYAYRLEVDGRTLVRRMTLLK